MMKVSIVLVVLGLSSIFACPDGISPCKCTDTLPGVSIDCTSAQSTSAVVDVFSKDWNNPHFDFFQVVPLTGKSSLDSLPDNMFGGKTFLHCWIGDSDIASVGSKAFAGLEDTLLEILLGKAEKLTSFPGDAWDEFTLLYKIEVMGNGISTLSSFGKAPELSEINFPFGTISSVDSGAFGDLPRLTHVDLSHNKFTSLTDGMFSSSSSVAWVLYLTDNMISEVSAGAFSGTLPSAVNLMNNQLKTLDEASFKPLLTSMHSSNSAIHHYLSVNGNPLECDCGIKWLAQDMDLGPLVKGAVCTNGDVDGTEITDLPDDFFADC